MGDWGGSGRGWGGSGQRGGRGGGNFGGRGGFDSGNQSGSQGQQICRFYQQGTCNRGSSCKFLHEGAQQGGGYQGGRGGGQGGGGWQDSGQANNWRGGGRGGRGGRFGGRGGRGYNQDNQERDEVPQAASDIRLKAELPAHAKKIAALCGDAATKQLYTGSADGTVKCWSTSTGEMISSVDMGGVVDTMFLSGGYLFVAVTTLAEEPVIRIWNVANGQNHNLSGHKKQIQCLFTAGGMLFSGSLDWTIGVWSFNVETGTFANQAVISQEQGGHRAPVHSFQSLGSFLFSSDRLGIIKVWELTSGKLAQTLSAHDDAIVSMMIWQDHLITSSLDSFVKVWSLMEQPKQDSVIEECKFAYSEDYNQDKQGKFFLKRGTGANKIIAMAGTLDHSGRPVLVISYVGEPMLRLYDMPEFSPRGALMPAPDTRSLYVELTPDFSQGCHVVVGDANGKLRFFEWDLSYAKVQPEGSMS